MDTCPYRRTDKNNKVARHANKFLMHVTTLPIDRSLRTKLSPRVTESKTAHSNRSKRR